MLKIAFCLFKYYPFGGLELDFLQIAKAAKARCHEVHIFTMEWQGEVPADFHIHLVKVPGRSNHKRAVNFSRYIENLAARNLYDVMVGFKRMAGLDIYFAADVCYAASALQKHAVWFQWTPRYRNFRWLEHQLVTSKAKILHITSQEKEDYQSHYPLPDDRFHLLPPGIQKTSGTPDERAQIKRQVRSELGVTDKELMLLMVGSDFKRKGVDRSLHAVAACKNTFPVKLIIAGRGKADKMLNLAKKLKITDQVKFLGGRDDIRDLMFGAEVLLHPAYEETAGKVILEALTCGLPVLVTANCGYAGHVARAKAGELIPTPFVQETMNHLLINMLQSDQKHYQENAYQYAGSTDLYSMVDQVIHMIELAAQRPLCV